MSAHPRHLPFLLTLFVALVSSGCGGTSDAPPPPPADAVGTPGDLTAFERRTVELETSERQRARALGDQRADLQRLQKSGMPLPGDAARDELTAEQRKLLEERISQERGSRKDLLQEILDQDLKLRELRGRIDTLSKQVPRNRVAKDGDRHDRIAMDFLLQQGVSADRAYQTVSKMNLEDTLLPGFRVWTYYANGQFGTWVTQGDAPISPNEVRRRVREELAALRVETAEIKAQNEELTTSNQRLQDDVKTAAAETTAAISIAEETKRAAEEAARVAANTVQFGIGTKRALERSRLIDGDLRLRTLDLPALRPLNLLAEKTVKFAAGEIDPELRRVRRVRIAPSSFKEGVDYAVQVQGLAVEVILLDADRFIRAGKFLVVIE